MIGIVEMARNSLIVKLLKKRKEKRCGRHCIFTPFLEIYVVCVGGPKVNNREGKIIIGFLHFY